MEAKPLTSELKGQALMIHAFREDDTGTCSILVSWPEASRLPEQRAWFHTDTPFPDDYLLQIITAIRTKTPVAFDLGMYSKGSSAN